MLTKEGIPWPHAPTHRLCSGGTFIVTAATYRRAHLFRQRAHLDVLHRGLLETASQFGWQLEAWAVFSNHYHFVGHSPPAEPGAGSLRSMLSSLHRRTAIWINGLDDAPGRVVWYNFWETRLTYERCYLARLRYVHENAVRHGLVPTANLYPWCSAGWFERTASAAQIRTIYSFPIDRVKVHDDFEVGGIE